MLTRKHYRAFAEVLANLEQYIPEHGDITSNERAFRLGAESVRNAIIADLVRICTNDNPRFDRARFLEASRFEHGAPMLPFAITESRKG